jgi:uncharacterized protein YabE (DUF348 family)
MERLKHLRSLRNGWLRLLPVLLAALGLILVFFATQRHLVVWVDGSAVHGSTHARTIGAALHDLGVELGPKDRVVPGVDHSLSGVSQVEVSHATPFILDLNGLARWIESPLDSPANLLAEQAVRLYPGDSLFIDGQPISNPDETIRSLTRLTLVRARTLTINDGERRRMVVSSAATLGEALEAVDIPIYVGDRVSPDLGTPLDSDLDVTIQRAGWLKVHVDGRDLLLRAAGPTVADSLAGAGISLTGLDYSMPGLGEPLPESRKIEVVRVEERVQVELEPVPFETVFQPLDTLELDSIQVLDPGTYGVLQNRVRIRLEDGEEVSRTVDEARVVVEPEPRKLGYGTKIVVRTLSTTYGTIEYWRAIPIYATSYSPCNLGVPYCGERTASGKSVQRGIVGVIRSWYNLMRGWPVFVPDYGPGTIEDIGAGIAGRDWIDLGFTDENFEPWHQWTTLYFLTPVPPLDAIPWILP